MTTTRPSRGCSVAVAVPGIALLLVYWAAMAGFAQNMSALPANAVGVLLLWTIVLIEAFVVGAAVVIAAGSRRWRSRGLQLLPWLAWSLVVANFAFLLRTGIY
jgi:hypothetical protein